VHGDAVAAALLAAAERIAEVEGIEAVTVRRVADEVGTTTRAVYSTFGSKDDLIAALGVRAFDVLGERVRRMRTTDDPVADLLQVGAIGFRDFARRHPGLFRAGFAALATARDVGPDFAPANRAAWTALVARVQRVEDAGLLGRRSVDAAATQFHCLCEGLAVNELRGSLGPPAVARRMWQQAFAALVGGWAAT
jgi:AcrR family transcriptional regulator